MAGADMRGLAPSLFLPIKATWRAPRRRKSLRNCGRPTRHKRESRARPDRRLVKKIGSGVSLDSTLIQVSSNIFIPVFLSDTSRPRSGSEVESKDPENVSADMPQQGIPPMICLALCHSPRSNLQKCMEENSLKLHGQEKHPRDASTSTPTRQSPRWGPRTCAYPALRDARGAQHDSS